MGLREKLVLAFVGFSTIVVAVATIPVGVLATDEEFKRVQNELIRRAELSAERAVGTDPIDAEALTQRFPAESRFDAWVLGRELDPLAAPSRRVVFPDPDEASELRRARPGVPATSRRNHEGQDRLYAAVRLVPDRDPVGTLWVTISLEQSNEFANLLWWNRAAIALAVLLISVLAGWMLSGRLTRRLARLAHAARTYDETGFAEPLPAGGSDEVADVAAALTELASRLEALRARHEQFVARASHQLRTPLTSIRLRLDELRTTDLDDELAREYMDETAGEVARMEKLTAQLLQMLSAGGAQSFEPASVGDAVTVAADRVAPLARKRRVEVRKMNIDDDMVVLARPGSLDEVLLNLVENAVEHAPAGTAVEVAAEERGDHALIAVTDAGPGIDEVTKERAFEPFYRPPSTRTGFGLGLAIAKRICDDAGAEVTLSDRPGGGTVARVRWPLWDRDEPGDGHAGR